ncbi:disease resistance protein RUN1-like [Prunus dulcis]|uniref:disease resistance protein RUN1-like n=1 Tax=Prunus dulcis TaxID=3755 RepID=UPI0014839FC6|nr:disease resistance protein RUN1-like [Prunus dulcis]
MYTRRTSSSSPSTTPQWKYDVFLSFRGDDTQKGFTDHLYETLRAQGIITFRDEPKISKGKSISGELIAAIEGSKFALIVLSQNYASSTWCLDELLHILKFMEAREAVLPIFYYVDPSHVRKQTGCFEKAFTQLEERFSSDDKTKVQEWRDALAKVADFSGWKAKDWYTFTFIIFPRNVRNLAHQRYNRCDMEKITFYIVYFCGELSAGVDDVRFIGIWGMGGIGKTTIARVVRERISPEFEFSIFLENVSDNVQKGGLISQQREILSWISMKTIDIFDVHEGSTMIRRLLRHKKVLLILDDVTNSDHLDYLAGKQEWFGSGSRVLITTRNEHLLIEHEVERRFQVKRLNHDDALKLFSWKAFGKDHPEKNYIDLSSCVVSYADGLPLALKVLGSFLRGRHVSAWNSALGKLRDLCNTVLGTLQISYDDLDDREKKIFLDIACFFNGEKEDRVIEILDSCGFCACIGIDVLIEKSLLTNSYGTLWMHQLLQEMGRELVNRECLDEPGNRSRLWRHEEGKHVLSKNTGTDAVESITMDKTGPVVHADAKCFSRMKKLRLLNLANVNLSNDLEYLSDNLRSLEWDGYPSKYFPLHFNPENLLELNMCHSHIESFWTGVKLLYNLKIFKLSHSLNLVNTPDFRGFPNLEYLILEGCIRLYKVDPSLGMLERITQINLKDCKSLVHLPRSVYGLKSVKVLNLSGCSKLDKLPNELGNAECLEELDVSGTSEVPIIQFVVPGNEIPEWFNHKSAEYIYQKEWFNPQSVEYPLSVELRPGWFTEKWMGFAVCLVFAIQERSPNCDPALDYPSFDYNYTHIITCKVDINGKEMTARRRPFAVLNAESGQAVSDHLWVVFFPRHFPQLWKGISDQIELPSGTEGWQGIFGQITFSITARVGHGVIVKQSAARLVYEGDLEELDPRFSFSLMACFSTDEWNGTTTAMRATTTGTTRT